MPVKNGDFVTVNYTCTVKESGEVIETTSEAVAREKALKRRPEDQPFEPRFIIVGEAWLPKGFEEALIGLEVGNQTTAELPPEKGYGPRDPSKVRLVPLRRFRAEGLTPVPGMHVNLAGRPALIRAVGAGRVQVDYNHPLAGKTLIYNASLEKILETEAEKIRCLVQRHIAGIKPESFKINLSSNELLIEMPEESFFLEGIQVSKKALSTDIEKFFLGIAKISFLETFKAKKEVESKETSQAPQIQEASKEISATPTQAVQH